MIIVNADGSIRKLEWTYKGRKYKIVATQSTGVNRPVWEAIDTIKREDGVYKDLTRRELKNYFK